MSRKIADSFQVRDLLLKQNQKVSVYWMKSVGQLFNLIYVFGHEEVVLLNPQILPFTTRFAFDKVSFIFVW